MPRDLPNFLSRMLSAHFPALYISQVLSAHPAPCQSRANEPSDHKAKGLKGGPGRRHHLGRSPSGRQKKASHHTQRAAERSVCGTQGPGIDKAEGRMTG